MSKLKILLPNWLVNYQAMFLKPDLIGGLLMAVMLIPQSMAYAMLAGLPPVFGLYAATLPLLAYAVFGSSPHLAVGPVAILSMLVATACAPLAEPGTSEYLQLVALLTLMVGAMQLLFGIVRAGFLVNFVSHAVISGFISASAIIIGLGQVRHLLGLPIDSGLPSWKLVGEIATHLGAANPSATWLGLAAMAVLAASRKFRPRFPAALIVLVGGTALTYFYRLDLAGLAIVGELPRGLPGWSAPTIEFSAMTRLFTAAMVILFVGYMESLAVAQWVASREKYRISANREFIGLGIANITAALFSGYTVTGGFSRTAVNYQAGSKSPLASVITAIIVLLVLLFLTSPFHYLPKTILAAIIIVAVAGLIDIKTPIKLFQIKPADGWTLLITFLVTLTVGIEQGIIVGIVFSLTLFIARSAHPRTALLGYVESEGVYRDIQRYPEARTYPGMLIVRVDASLYFANAGFVENQLRQQITDHPECQWIIFEMSGVNDIDAVAITTLGNLLDDYATRKLRFAFAAVKAPVRAILSQAEWYKDQQRTLTYSRLEKAVEKISQKLAVPQENS